MWFRSSGSSRKIRAIRAATAATLLAATTASADPPARTNNWNQWDDDARDGVMEGTTKLSLGVDYTSYTSAPSEGHTVRLALELEHLLRSRWGVVGTLGLPLQGEWIAPATLGLRFHFVPKFPLDPYLGLGGGVAWVAPDTLTALAAPIASARAGLSFYYLGLFFAQIEGGYDVVRYGREGIDLDLSGVTFAGRLGLAF